MRVMRRLSQPGRLLVLDLHVVVSWINLANSVLRIGGAISLFAVELVPESGHSLSQGKMRQSGRKDRTYSGCYEKAVEAEE